MRNLAHAACIPIPSRGTLPFGGNRTDAEAGMPGYVGNKEEYLRRLRRVEGQVRGLQRMIDRDEYCIDVLTQVSAATKALQSVALGLLDEHLGHCVAEAIAEGGENADAKVREASDAIARLVRS
jgi:CsoR family transcriptional regulator, copper-sensing transcriptional repressor